MEAEIVAREGGVDEGTARDLVLIGQKVRNLRVTVWKKAFPLGC